MNGAPHHDRLNSLRSRFKFGTLGAVFLLLGLFALGSQDSMRVLAGPRVPLPAEATEPAGPAPVRSVSSLITEYNIPTANSTPFGITAGADGALWFAEGSGQKIGRITTDGNFTEFPLQVAHTDQHFLIAGPDGAIWFTDDWQNKIGRITGDGSITEYSIPSGVGDTDDDNVAYTTSLPRGLIVGADGALWFSENEANKIGRITTDGKLTEYPLPANSGPVGLASGRDSAVWFTEKNTNQIGRITTDGKLTEYPVPTPSSFLLRIAAGPDGALWFTEFQGDKIGRISINGLITEYALPPKSGPVGIIAGSDQAIWFTEYNGNKIGRISMDGQITEYGIPTADSVPFSIAAGADGAVWFTENAGGKIGRLQVQAAPESTTMPPAQAAASAPLGEHVAAQWTIALPEDVVFAFGSVWVPSRRTPNVTTRIDPLSNQIVAVISGTGYLAKSALAVGDSVWIAGQANDLAPIDPKTNTLGAKVPGDHPHIAYGFGSIWAVGHQGEPLDRIDPATSKIMVSIPLGGTVADSGEENTVLVTTSAVWAITNGELIKIDPATNNVTLRTTFDQVAREAAAQTAIPAGKGTDFLWVAGPAGLARLDPDTGKGLAYLPLTPDQLGDADVTVTDQAVWLGGSGQIERVDVATNQIDATYKVSPGPTIVRIGLGSVWVAYSDSDVVQRLDVAP